MTKQEQIIQVLKGKGKKRFSEIKKALEESFPTDFPAGSKARFSATLNSIPGIIHEERGIYELV